MAKEKSERTNILVVYAAMIPTARLIMDMMKRLVAVTGGKLRGRVSVDVNKKDIAWADVVIFVRGADPYMVTIGKAAREAGRYCVMYLDDDLLNVPSKGIWTYKNALKECLHWCNLLWSSNPNILKKYSIFMQEPKCVQEKVFELIDELLPANQDTDEIRIVYAGSPSHASGLQRYIVPALNDICKKYNNVNVTFIGLQEDDLNKVKFKAEYVSWFQNYKNYKKFILENRYHIGLAVVPDTEFSRCKFYNKFLEYGKMGVMGIYSDCEPYRFVVRNGVNGLLSKNYPQDWEQNIEKAIVDQKMRKDCISNAQEYIKREFNMDEVLHKLMIKIPELEGFKANHSCEIKYVGQKMLIGRIGIWCWNYIAATQFGYRCIQRLVNIWHWLRNNKY